MKTNKKETKTGDDFQKEMESIRNGSFFGVAHRGVVPVQLHNGASQHAGFAAHQTVAPYAWGIPPYVPAYGVHAYAPSLYPAMQNPAFFPQAQQQVNPAFIGSLEFNPLVNICENDEEYIIELVTPGYHNEDCKVKVKDNVLYVNGNREHDDEDFFYTLKEYRSSYFERAFLISDEIDSDEIVATCANGILTITLTKKSEEERQEKEIEITEEELA